MLNINSLSEIAILLVIKHLNWLKDLYLTHHSVIGIYKVNKW